MTSSSRGPGEPRDGDAWRRETGDAAFEPPAADGAGANERRLDEARQEYDSLRAAIDDFATDVRSTHGEHIQCRRGCYACCIPPAQLRRVEAEQVRRAVADLDDDARDRIRERATDPQRLLCPLLENGACVVYQDRPIACRGKGMPMATKNDDGAYDLDYCRLNFTQVPEDFELRRRHILNIDGSYEILDGLNERVCQAQGLDAEADGFVSFKQVALGRLVSVPAHAPSASKPR